MKKLLVALAWIATGFAMRRPTQGMMLACIPEEDERTKDGLRGISR